MSYNDKKNKLEQPSETQLKVEQNGVEAFKIIFYLLIKLNMINFALNYFYL